VAVAHEAVAADRHTLTKQTLAAIQGSMAANPAPWPEAWGREYLETVRQAIATQADDAQYPERLRILRDGFGAYWKDTKNREQRSFFEVRLAEIRWYVEHLMGAELPDETQRQKLRDQYTDLCDHAASSLLTQFPFLDLNAVHAAKADHLAQCYRNIDAPLLPIFLRPFSDAQIQRIKERWHDLRYARVDLWRQLGQEATTVREGQETLSGKVHPDYLLTHRSLAQLRPHIWALAAPPPESYRAAVANEIAAQKRRAESKAEARRRERRLPIAVRQTEYISFLLAALLETAEMPQWRVQQPGGTVQLQSAERDP